MFSVISSGVFEVSASGCFFSASVCLSLLPDCSSLASVCLFSLSSFTSSGFSAAFGFGVSAFGCIHIFFDARLLFHIPKAFFHKNFPIGLEPISIPLTTNPTPGIHFNTFQDKPIITA